MDEGNYQETQKPIYPFSFGVSFTRKPLRNLKEKREIIWRRGKVARNGRLELKRIKYDIA